jgi:TPR repeat protein
MKQGWGLGLGFGALSLFCLSGCGELGNTPAGSLPRDVHAAPESREVAEHPCRYGDVARCIAKCTRDDPQACNAAGVMFEFDEGASSEPALASGFYSRACDGNYAQGCNNLAWLYLRGAGVPKDQPHAMLLFMTAFDAAKLACLQGDASGCLLAGEILYEGRGVEADEQQAVAFFKRACDGGEQQACSAAY